jgi:hypothetical protein
LLSAQLVVALSETGVRVMPANLEDGPKSRGTKLFEEFERYIPYLAKLDEHSDPRFTKAVNLLLDHFKLCEVDVDKTKIFVAQPIAANLKQLLNAYLQKTMSVPTAIFVVMAYIESTYLEGEDAELVHKLTSLHIDRAKSIEQSKIKSKSVAQTSTSPSGARRPRKNLLLPALTSGRRAARVLLRQA